MTYKFQTEPLLARKIVSGKTGKRKTANLPRSPDGRNKTVWLAQAKLVYNFEGASEHPSTTCLCTHLCNARCVLDKPSGSPRCYLGPGVAATWLALRAAGLAQDTGPPLQSRAAMVRL